MPADGTLLWQILVLGVLVGLGVGFAIAYFLVLRNRRAESLRDELQAQKARFEDYQRRVDAHFVETSELFQDLTERYRAIYDHLANGARALCSEDLLAQRLAVVESRLLVEQRPPRGPGEQAEEPAPQGVEAAAPEPPAAPSLEEGRGHEAAPRKPGSTTADPEAAPARATTQPGNDPRPQPEAAKPGAADPEQAGTVASATEAEHEADRPPKPTLH